MGKGGGKGGSVPKQQKGLAQVTQPAASKDQKRELLIDGRYYDVSTFVKVGAAQTGRKLMQLPCPRSHRSVCIATETSWRACAHLL